MAADITQTRTTNTALAIMLGDIGARISTVESTLGKIDKTLNGNGKPGLIENYRCLDGIVSDHLKQAKEEAEAKLLLAEETKIAKDKLARETKESVDKLAEETKERKEKISARTWTVIMAVITFVITQTGGLVILFLRTGGIK